MSKQPADAFEIVVRKGADEETAERGDFIKISDYLYASKVRVPADELAANVQVFISGLQGIFAQPPEEQGGFKVESITVTAEISAKGTLNILGTGGELAGKGGITFVFKRKI
jgi:hypothetical protein